MDRLPNKFYNLRYLPWLIHAIDRFIARYGQYGVSGFHRHMGRLYRNMADVITWRGRKCNYTFYSRRDVRS